MQLRLWVSLACVSAAMAGCAPMEGRVVECKAPNSSPQRAGPALVGQAYGMEMSPIPLDAVQFTDAQLWERVAVQHLSAERTGGDTVRVNARLVNCTSQPTAVYVRTSFLDSRQASVEQPSAWQIVHLQPRATGAYSESSATTRVSNYLIEVRPSN